MSLAKKSDTLTFDELQHNKCTASPIKLVHNVAYVDALHKISKRQFSIIKETLICWENHFVLKRAPPPTDPPMWHV